MSCLQRRRCRRQWNIPKAEGKSMERGKQESNLLVFMDTLVRILIIPDFATFTSQTRSLYPGLWIPTGFKDKFWNIYPLGWTQASNVYNRNRLSESLSRLMYTGKYSPILIYFRIFCPFVHIVIRQLANARLCECFLLSACLGEFKNG